MKIRLGIIALLIGLLFVAGIALAALRVSRNPVPQTIEVAQGSTVIRFAVDRTHFVFPADCSTGQWQVSGIREVYFGDRGVAGSGQLTTCTGDALMLHVVFQDGSSHTYTVERDVLMLNPLMAVSGIAALTLLSLAAYWLGAGRLLQTRRGEYALVLGLAVVLVALLLMYTRTNNLVVEGTTDDARTLEIALHGWIGNPNLWAPWAYRPLMPLTAQLIGHVLGQPPAVGFAVLSFSGMVVLLVLTYALARRFGADFRIGFISLLVVWMSYFVVRFSLSDVYRPDSWAYALMLMALLLLWDEHWGWCLLVCCLGILTREFLAVPALLLMCKLLIDVIRRRSLSALVWLVITGLVIAATVILPRRLIPVAGNRQIFWPDNDGYRDAIILPLLNKPRDTEFLMGLLVFMLPALLLLTPSRLSRAWRLLNGYRGLLALYSLLILGLVMYGGSGVQRYVTYLLPLLIVLLAVWLKDAGSYEVVFMLVVMALCNRLFWMVGIDPFTVPVTFSDLREVADYLPRFAELTLYFVALLILRLLQIIRSGLSGVSVDKDLQFQ